MAKSHLVLVKAILVFHAAKGSMQKNLEVVVLPQPSGYYAKWPGTAASIFT